MHRKLFAAVLLLILGCQGGGLAERRYQAITDPRLTISEQEQRGRAELALPEKSSAVGPQTGAEGPWYRGAYNK